MSIEISTIGAEIMRVKCNTYSELRDAGHDDLADILLDRMGFTYPIHRDSLSDCWKAGSNP